MKEIGDCYFEWLELYKLEFSSEDMVCYIK